MITCGDCQRKWKESELLDCHPVDGQILQLCPYCGTPCRQIPVPLPESGPIEYRGEVKRLGGKMKILFDVLRDRQRHSVEDLCKAVHSTRDASVTALLRALRSPKNGGHDVKTEIVDGVAWYWMVE